MTDIPQRSPDPTKALNYLLNSMAPATFVSRIRAALEPGMGYTPEDVKSLLDSLGNMGFERAVARANEVASYENQEKLHCVRCHKSYLEAENGIEACVVSHVRIFNPLSPSSHSGEGDSGHPCSCNKSALTGVVVPQPCVMARHTTNIDDIRRLKGGLVRSCEEEGCSTLAERVVGVCSRMEKLELEKALSGGEGEEKTAGIPDASFTFQVKREEPSTITLGPKRPIKGLPSSARKTFTSPSAASKEAASPLSASSPETESTSASSVSTASRSNSTEVANDLKFDREAFQAILNCKAEQRGRMGDKDTSDESGTEATGKLAGMIPNKRTKRSKKHETGDVKKLEPEETKANIFGSRVEGGESCFGRKSNAGGGFGAPVQEGTKPNNAQGNGYGKPFADRHVFISRPA